MVEVVGSNVLRIDLGEFAVRRLESHSRTNPNEKLMLCVQRSSVREQRANELAATMTIRVT